MPYQANQTASQGRNPFGGRPFGPIADEGRVNYQEEPANEANDKPDNKQGLMNLLTNQ